LDAVVGVADVNVIGLLKFIMKLGDFGMDDLKTKKKQGK